jgi:NitT/TauT family transport system permease protein
VSEKPAPSARSALVSSPLFAGVIGLTVFVALWESIVRVFDVKRYVLLPPSTIVGELLERPGFYWEQTWVTALEALLGYLLALAVALAWGALMARVRFIEHATGPVAVLVQVTPIIAYAPSVVLWLGAGMRPIVLLTSLICLVPLLFNVVAGLRAADPAALEVLASVNASTWEQFHRVRLPSSLPFLVAATRTCVGLALIGAVLAEQFALVDRGLGQLIRRAFALSAFEQVWAAILATAVLGGVLVGLLDIAERRLLHWHASQRA